MLFLGTLVLGRLLTCACDVMLPLSSQSLEAVTHVHVFSVAHFQQTLTTVLARTMEHGSQDKYICCPGRMQADNAMTSTVTANMH